MFGSEAWQEVLLGHKSLDGYWLEIGSSLGLASPGEIQAFRERYFADEAIDEGVLDLLHKLHGRYKLAVLSNAPPRLTQWLENWDILHLFDVVVCSGDVGLVKPDPAIFYLTLARLVAAPDEAVFLDDSPAHVAAACALGLLGIHFTTAEALVGDLDRLLAEQESG